MAEFLVCFTCCIGDQPQPKKRRRLDRNMIGVPMNFVHVTHVGTKETASCLPTVESMQEQMKSKGGYDHNNSPSAQI